MKKQPDLNNTGIAFAYKNNRELKRTLFIFRLMQHPGVVRLLTRIARWIIDYGIPLKFLLRKTVFNVFCAGESRSEARGVINHLQQYNVHTVLDYVAEGDNTEDSFSSNQQTILSNIRFVAENSRNAFVGVKLSGLEDVRFLEEVQVATLARNDETVKERVFQLIARVDAICDLAGELGVKVYFDAEERSTQDMFDFIVEKMMRRYNKEQVIVFNTLQMYLKDRLQYLDYIIQEARSEEYLLGLKLVRGAYVEKERTRAAEAGVESPVFDTKKETDESFDQAVRISLWNHDIVTTCLATHNQQSVELAVSLIRNLPIEDHYEKVYFSQLYGMSDNLTFNLAKAHFHTSKYMPYGEVKKAIPYLLRRAEENSSVEGQVGREFDLLVQEKRRRGI